MSLNILNTRCVGVFAHCLPLRQYRGSGGNPQCGGVSAVFSRSYLGEASLLASPIDTGLFEGDCDQGQASVGYMGDVPALNCGVWPESSGRVLGSPPYVHHLLPTYLGFFNATQADAGDDYPYLNLARLLTRLLSRNTYKQPLGRGSYESFRDPSASSSSFDGNIRAATDGNSSALPLNFVENTLGYFEYNPAAGIPLAGSGGGHGGIKMMVGMFELMFGTEEGDALRSWCVAQGWPLAWAYNPTMSYFRCGPDGEYPGCIQPNSLTAGMDTASARLLDPTVLAQVPAGHNVTPPPTATEAFSSAWSATNVTSASREDVQTAWNGLLTSPGIFGALGAEPLFYGSCASEACSAVLVESQACVCPP